MKADLYNAQARTAGIGGLAHRTAAGFVVLTSADGGDLIELINTRQSESDLIDQIVVFAQDRGPKAFAMLFTAGGDLYLIASGSASASISSPSTKLSMSPAPGQVLVHPLSAGINETAANIRLHTTTTETATVTTVELGAGTIVAEWVEVAVGGATIDLGTTPHVPPQTPIDTPAPAELADMDDEAVGDSAPGADGLGAAADYSGGAQAGVDPDESVESVESVEDEAELADEAHASDLDPAETGDAATSDAGEAGMDAGMAAGLAAAGAAIDAEPVVEETPTPAAEGPLDEEPPPPDPTPPDPVPAAPTPADPTPATGAPADPVQAVPTPADPTPAVPEPPAPADVPTPPAEPAPAPPVIPAGAEDAVHSAPAAPEPPAPATPAPPAEPAPTPPPTPVAAVAAVGEPVMVLGVACPQGHHNHPDAVYCSQCGTKMGVHHTTVLMNGPRPPLGVLVVDDGTTYSLSEDLVIGREPTSHVDVVAGIASPMILTDDTLSLSRKHARIVLDGWQVAVRDLGSSNGTYLSRSGQSEAWTRVDSASTTALEPGDRLRVGGRIIQVELHHVR